ncbi:MAG: rhomboid family intramembrane serine protease [endosymbiont of Galathealinum brachiosum]|uniref:Rhomboid family intramembrane serine protease n=1 Tax=endosymbiont of Galathealinum brachiosum TaxID=2200906 RepID=A0A370DIR5_9GAMM|nr:MAG: rhomboid family intramembrane serine protease [endosymbiont of Galathealinum brachiosum]
MLGLLHERSDHIDDRSLIKLVSRDTSEYFTIDITHKIDENLEKHLYAFEKLTPSSLDGSLMHFPDEINPLPMLTSAVAHASWSHVIFNLIFFIAFAPAIEVLISNRLKYLGLLVALSFVTSISYSLAVLINGNEPVPSLGLSGVVMGMIGVFAYLMPHARIRVFFWFFTIIKIFFIPAWILALWYIGMDTLDMLFSDDYGGINLIAHVSGGFGGYILGYIFFKEQREIIDDLGDEIKDVNRSHQSGSFGTLDKMSQNELKNRQQQMQLEKNYEQHISEIHRYVRGRQDSKAINLIIKDYEVQSASVEIFEELFERIKSWGDSRTLLCLGRLLINLLIEKRKYARALLYVEMCQEVTYEFVLADPDNVLFLANTARENRQYKVAYLLVRNLYERYGEYIDLESTALVELELLVQNLNMKEQAKVRMKELLMIAEGDFKADLMKLSVLLRN